MRSRQRNGPLSAGIYTRVSHDPKGRGRSVADQETECRAEVDAEGWHLVGVYCDNDRGASRYSRKVRPEWSRLLEDLRAGRLDVLVTWESSRAQRDLEVYVDLRKICRETGTLWRYDGQTYDLTDDDDAYRTAQDALDAEREAGKTRKRVLRAVRSRATHGRPHGKYLYGYRRERDPETGEYVRTVPHPDEAPIVKEMFRRFLDGDTMTGIARDLTRRGLETPQSAAIWRGSTIHNLLKNPAFLGRRASKAGHATIEDAWPALIDEATWDLVQARIADPNRPRRQDSAVKFLLSGIAVCGVCGGKLVHNGGRSRKTSKAYPTYICHDRRCLGRAAGLWTPTEARGLEGQVVEYVLELWAGDPRIGRRDDDPRVGEAEAELAGLRAQLRMWQDSAGDEGVSPAAVAAAERKLGPRIDAAERQLSGLRARASLPDLAGRSLREAWPGLGLAQQRAIIAASVTVKVMPVGRGRRYDPATVVIRPRWG